MKDIILLISRKYDINQSTLSDYASPFSKYLLICAFWTVLWSGSIVVTSVFYVVFIAVSVGSRINPFAIIYILILVVLVAIGHFSYSMLVSGKLTPETLHWSMKIHIILGSPVVLFYRTGILHQFYACSSLFGGTVAVVILAFGRGLSYLPNVVKMTREACVAKLKRPIRNPLLFAMSLFGSCCYFARTYSDAVEIRSVIRVRGPGALRTGVSTIDVLFVIVALLLVAYVGFDVGWWLPSAYLGSPAPGGVQ